MRYYTTSQPVVLTEGVLEIGSDQLPGRESALQPLGGRNFRIRPGHRVTMRRGEAFGYGGIPPDGVEPTDGKPLPGDENLKEQVEVLGVPFRKDDLGQALEDRGIVPESTRDARARQLIEAAGG